MNGVEVFPRCGVRVGDNMRQYIARPLGKFKTVYSKPMLPEGQGGRRVLASLLEIGEINSQHLRGGYHSVGSCSAQLLRIMMRRVVASNGQTG